MGTYKRPFATSGGDQRAYAGACRICTPHFDRTFTSTTEALNAMNSPSTFEYLDVDTILA